MLSKKFRSNKFYQVTRCTFKYGNEWDEMESTVTVWDTYEKAMAYIERYNSGLKFASAQIEVNNLDREITYEDYKKGNYNIVSFQKIYDVTLDGTEDTQPEEIIYTADEEVEQAQKKDEKRYIFYVEDYTEKRESPVLYVGYTKKEITGMVQEWANKNNHVYKIFIANKTSDKALAGRVFFKVINWKQTYKVGKTGSRLRFGEFSYEEAEKYCKKYAEKDGIAYTIYEVKLDEYGRDDTVQVINIEPPIKYYIVKGYSAQFSNLRAAINFAKGVKVDKRLIIYAVRSISNLFPGNNLEPICSVD